MVLSIDFKVKFILRLIFKLYNSTIETINIIIIKRLITLRFLSFSIIKYSSIFI